MRNKTTVFLACLLIGTIVLSGLALRQERLNYVKDNFGSFSGTITVTVRNADGSLVSQKSQDLIVSLSYDYIACIIWDTGCGTSQGTGIGESGQNQLFPATTYTTTATISAAYAAISSLTGMALSTSSQTSSVCINVLTANGFAPLQTGASHTVGGNTPIVTMTGAWTNTGSTTVISSVCLVAAMGATAPIQFGTTVIAPAGTMTDYAFQNLSPTQSIANSQSISIQWSFNM